VNFKEDFGCHSWLLLPEVGILYRAIQAGTHFPDRLSPSAQSKYNGHRQNPSGGTRMKYSPFLVAALLLASFTLAQDAAKKDTPVKPADPPSKVVLDSWNDIGRKLIAMAEDFPENKYDFKPTPAQRSFEEQLLHAAGANYYFTNLLTGAKGPVDENPKPDQYKTREALVAFVKKSFADGAAAIKAKGDKGMSELVVDPFAHQQVRVSDMAYGFTEHCGEHYGQLVVYYRLSGLVPPESRPKK
jgi:uncharacterized damage-inducible protein DinB